MIIFVLILAIIISLFVHVWIRKIWVGCLISGLITVFCAMVILKAVSGYHFPLLASIDFFTISANIILFSSVVSFVVGKVTRSVLGKYDKEA